MVAQAKPDYKPAVSYHVPAPGDAVPDFKLRNQDGRPIHLGQFHGKSLVVTFIYTRCPSPEFCPRVTRNFAALEKQLAPAPRSTPKRICSASALIQSTTRRSGCVPMARLTSAAERRTAFTHWEFAVPEKPVLAEMAKFFDLGMTSEADTTITHTLSTTLIGPDGKVVRFYPGNEWTPEQVLGDVTLFHWSLSL